MRGPLDLLDGIDSGETDDCGPMLNDGVNRAFDGCRIDQRTDGVVNQHDVIRRCRQGSQRMGDGFLAVIAAFAPFYNKKMYEQASAAAS